MSDLEEFKESVERYQSVFGPNATLINWVRIKTPDNIAKTTEVAASAEWWNHVYEFDVTAEQIKEAEDASKMWSHSPQQIESPKQETEEERNERIWKLIQTTAMSS